MRGQRSQLSQLERELKRHSWQALEEVAERRKDYERAQSIRVQGLPLEDRVRLMFQGESEKQIQHYTNVLSGYRRFQEVDSDA